MLSPQKGRNRPPPVSQKGLFSTFLCAVSGSGWGTEAGGSALTRNLLSLLRSGLRGEAACRAPAQQVAQNPGSVPGTGSQAALGSNASLLAPSGGCGSIRICEWGTWWCCLLG